MPQFFANVNKLSDLNFYIKKADGDTTSGDTYIITLPHNVVFFLEGTPLAAINLHPGVTLGIEGNNSILDGSGAQRGLFVYAGKVNISDLSIQDMVAHGGNGGFGAGGGGAGLGGGLFVGANVKGDPGKVTLTNVSFSDNKAVGGGGGGGSVIGYYGGGGGGGLSGGGGGRSNGHGGGGGGGIGVPGNGGAGGGGLVAPAAVAGGTGLLPGGGGCGSGGTGGFGGGDRFAGGAGGKSGGGGGGGGGGGAFGTFLAGGGGGGGVGGGGGGDSFSPHGRAGGGGNGGFGGGVGGGGYGEPGFANGGRGGFGGGGGGGNSSGVGGGTPGFGGGHAGAASLGGGGGGLAAGGDIFVQEGATLSIGGGFPTNVFGGLLVGGTGNHSGYEFANGIYLQGNGKTLTFTPSASSTLTVGGVIGDDGGSAQAADYGGVPGYTEGHVGITVNGPGTLDLTGNNTYSGATKIKAGTLELGRPLGELGSGSITGNVTFEATGVTLQFDAGTHQLSGAIIGAVAGDRIDLRFQKFASGDQASWQQNTGTLSLINNGTTLVGTTLTLAGHYKNSNFIAKDDGSGGTLIQVVGTASGPPGRPPQAI